jgi:hypothetical protein
MQKISLPAKCTIFAILIALVLSSFPISNVLAKGNNQNLENKWSQLVTNYNRQSINHKSAHNWVDHWLMTSKNATASDKAEVRKHLVICNSAIASAGTVVAQHAGFDMNGKVIDKSLARKSIKDLTYYLRQHAGSIKNLHEHVNK